MDPGICIPDLLFPLPTHKAELSRRRARIPRVTTLPASQVGFAPGLRRTGTGTAAGPVAKLKQ